MKISSTIRIITKGQQSQNNNHLIPVPVHEESSFPERSSRSSEL